MADLSNRPTYSQHRLCALILSMKESLDSMNIQLRAMRKAFEEREKNEQGQKN